MNKVLRIKEILSEQGISINELADRLGMHRVTLSKEINGNPRLETLIDIGQALNVKIDELFYHISSENYVITKNNFNNIMIFKDKNLWFQGMLPHFIDGDFSCFNLSFDQYNFSVSPSAKDVYDFVFSDRNIEEQIYIGELKGRKIIRLFNTMTYLTASEYTSLETALKLYKNNYQECYNDILQKLGAWELQRIDDTNRFRLSIIDRDDWCRLLKLAKMYDLDENQNDFEVFDARGNCLTIYNNVSSGYNLKTRIFPILDESNEFRISLSWICPTDYDRNGLLTGDILTAQESYELLHKTLIPKARKLFR